MAKAFDEWKVLGHRPIEKLSDNLWHVVGDVPQMSIERFMVLARMNDGRVVIHNPIALDEDEMEEIEAWGTPAFIVVPNGWHRLDCVVFKKRYPAAEVVCPAGSRKRIEQVIAVDSTYGEFSGDDAVTLEPLPGVKEFEGVMKVRSADGVTAVFNDLLFNQPHGRGLSGLFFRAIGSTGGPKIIPLLRLYTVRDKAALAAYLDSLADIPDLTRLIPGHGHIIHEDAPGTLRQVAARLG